jgi:DNA processing protein
MVEITNPSVAVCVLAGLDGMGPRRLHRVLQAYDPATALAAIRDGTIPSFVAASELSNIWAGELCEVDELAVARQLRDNKIVVTYVGHRDHPALLSEDIDPAPVLFRRGKALGFEGPKVAIIGTRRSSGLGREVARELGFGLAQAGVSVVSGLALGVDGAAHQGALAAQAAPPVAVVGGGPDVVYPKRHADLWQDMVASGTVASEAPPGAAPVAWRFPARNRLIAAFSDLVVVVESRAAGGSMLTVNEAIRRGRDVMAVPGSVRNPAAVGTNQLIAEGCAPVMSVEDVLVALGLTEAQRSGRRSAVASPAPTVPSHLVVVLDAIDDGPTSIERVVDRSGESVVSVLSRIDELVALDLVVHDGIRVRRA